MLSRLGVAAFFGSIGDQVAEIVLVIPIVRQGHMLTSHVVFVDALRSKKALACALVIAQLIEDMTGHMHYVTRSGCSKALIEPLLRFGRLCRDSDMTVAKAFDLLRLRELGEIDPRLVRRRSVLMSLG
jgi:hypothetical protein